MKKVLLIILSLNPITFNISKSHYIKVKDSLQNNLKRINLWLFVKKTV